MDLCFVLALLAVLLDVYEIPSEGTIPASWTSADLDQAHASSRSYEERILILNTMRYREKKYEDPLLIERLLSNHLEIGETTAATYYTEALIKKSKSTEESNFYRVLALYIQALEAKKREPIGRISIRLREKIEKIKAEIKVIGLRLPLTDIALAYCSHFLEADADAHTLAARVAEKKTLHPLERYLSFALLLELHDKESTKVLIPYYEIAIGDKNLSNESRLYYTQKYLAELEAIYGNSIPSRKSNIEALKAKLEADAADILKLLEFELKTFVLAAASDKKAEDQAYKDLNQMMTEDRTKYFLRRGQYIRAIANFHRFDKLKFLDKIASVWLNYTKSSDTEFAYAAAQYNYATMDRAYLEISKKHYEEAAQVFVMGVRQTDDLEAHFGLNSIRVEKLRTLATLQKEYAELVKGKIIDVSADFAKILQDLIEMEMSHSKVDSSSVQNLLDRTEALGPVGTNHAIYYQVLGFLNYKKVEVGKVRYKYDKGAFKMAHRNYIIALDLAHDNVRLKAATLKLLARLHALTENYDLATFYYSRREELPFLDAAEEKAFRWFFARTLFYSHRTKDGLKQIEKGLELASSGDEAMMFRERAAFYALYAPDFAKADSYYRELFKDKKFTQMKVNSTKALLGHGYALLKLKRYAEAEKTLNAAATNSLALKTLEVSGDRLVNFNPERIQINAFGLMARYDPSPKKAIDYQQKRIAVQKKVEGNFDSFSTTESLWRSTLAGDYSQLALLHEKAKDTKAMGQALLDANAVAADLGDLDATYYRTFLNLLAFAVANPKVIKKSEDLENKYNAMLKAFSELDMITTPDLYKRAKIRLFWNAFSGDKGRLATLETAENLARMKDEIPEKYTELEQYDIRLKR